MKKKHLIIDVHHHWMPPGHYLRPEPHLRQGEEIVHEPDRFRIRRAGVQLFSPPKMTADIEEQIRAMDRAGVDQAALHLGVWLDWIDLKSARFINDQMAEIAARYPDRIVPLAHVPALESEGLKELKRAVVELGCKGVGINTHVGGALLDSERFYPFYQTVSDLDIPILVHPAAEISLAHPHGMEEFNLTRNLGRAFDTTLNIVRLILSGTLDRFPRLRFAFSHLGGAFFALKNRLNPSYFDGRPRNFFDKHKRRLFVDTAPPFWSPEEIRFAVRMMGEGQVLMGSDFPTIGQLKDAVKIIQQAEASPRVKRRLLGENALRLFRQGSL